MGFGLHCLWLFPFIAGTTWLFVLLTLLATWIIQGCPRYPGQSNPFVAYISDIGAFSAKPVFLIGSTIVAISFVLTIYSLHYSRYAPRMYHFADRDSPTTKLVSRVAVFTSVVASVSLVALTVLDTYRFPQVHIVIMTWCFLSLDATSYSLTYVWLDEMSPEAPFQRLKKYCRYNSVIVSVAGFLGLVFLILAFKGWWVAAGILEWVVTILGGLWLLTFIGYLWVPEDGVNNDERQTLLSRREAGVEPWGWA